MRICQGCGGVIGRDCFNEHECIEIANSNNLREELERQEKLCQQIGQAILQASTECLCRPIRREQVEVSKIIQIFADHGIYLSKELPF